MIKIDNPADCCGCTACASVCNHDAITMKPDALGFLYPEVDTSKCMDCGLCEKVCSFKDNYNTSLNLPEPIVYGARHKDIDEVMRSRSGAVFAAISDYILENGGVVYGAGYTDHFRVVHKRATSKEQRDEFRGSKYVQSDLSTVFPQVKNDLKEGITVLFSGTPCQTAGLNSFVGSKLRENLILVDIVCHGVPSPFIWQDYLAFIEKKYGIILSSVNFRDKLKYGWKAHCESFSSPDVNENWFTRVFYQHIMLRHSCYNCHFCNTKRPSDITLADFWGWEKCIPNINNDNLGVSLVFINTVKGDLLFNHVSENLSYDFITDKAYMQPNLKSPSSPHPKRLEFESEYSQFGFDFVYGKNYNECLEMRVKLFYNKVKSKIKDIIK